LSSEVSAINFGNPALDRGIGGVPLPSLMLVEGPNDSGKSVLCQQLAYGATEMGLSVKYMTTENTFITLVKQMDELSYNVTKKVISGSFSITTLHTQGLPWNAALASLYLETMARFILEDTKSTLIVIDSLTSVAAQATPDSVLKFFAELRTSLDETNRCIVVTLHPYALVSDLLVRIRSMCDGHLVLSIRESRGKLLKSLEVSKLRGAKMKSLGTLTFDVEPDLGIKVSPLTSMKG
jgi:flagellar protein FlaH